MIKTNFSLCQSTNPIRLITFYYGCAMVDTTWRGNVPNPSYSRLFYITQGNASITTGDGHRVPLEQGKWYLLPAGCSFSYACEEMMEHLYFHFKLCNRDGIDLLRKCPAPCSLNLPESNIPFLMKGLDCHSVADGLRIRQEAYGILLAFIDKHCINLQTKALSPGIERAVNYIRYHKSMKLTNKEIAEHAFISVSSLTKGFQKELSMSVHEYISDMVLLEAALLLSNTDMSILQISDAFDFCDQFYFSRLFRNKFGISPRAYRKSKYI